MKVKSMIEEYIENKQLYGNHIASDILIDRLVYSNSSIKDIIKMKDELIHHQKEFTDAMWYVDYDRPSYRKILMSPFNITVNDLLFMYRGKYTSNPDLTYFSFTVYHVVKYQLSIIDDYSKREYNDDVAKNSSIYLDMIILFENLLRRRIVEYLGYLFDDDDLNRIYSNLLEYMKIKSVDYDSVELGSIVRDIVPIYDDVIITDVFMYEEMYNILVTTSSDFVQILNRSKYGSLGLLKLIYHSTKIDICLRGER